MLKIKSIGFLLWLIWVSTGCSGITTADQPDGAGSITLDQNTPVGQTFTAEYDGLRAIVLQLEPSVPGQGELRLQLYASPTADLPITSTTIPLTEVDRPGNFVFPFPLQPTSTDQDFFARLEMIGAGEIRVFHGPGEAYLDGSAYQSGKPLDLQLIFSLKYATLPFLTGLFTEGLRWLGWIAAMLAILFIPGYALFSLLFSGWRYMDWKIRLALSGGAGLAFYPVLYVWVNLLKLPINFTSIVLIIAISAGIIIWKRRQPAAESNNKETSPADKRYEMMINISFLIILGLLIFSRLWAIRSLAAPMWGDSYQHTMLAQLMIDNQGLPAGWEPYIPYQSLSVHFGFSAVAALFSWLTNTSATDATLITGQLINILAILSLYPLALRVSRGSAWAGLAAMVVGGLLSPLPAYYINWGRYAQLAGQAVLPVALWVVWEVAGNHRMTEHLDRTPTYLKRLAAPDFWRGLVLSSLILAGMMLCYYRMPLYFAAFMAAWLVGEILVTQKLKLKPWLVLIGRLILIAAFAGILLLPWILSVKGSSLSKAVAYGVTVGKPLARVFEDYQAWLNFANFFPVSLLVISLLAFAWSLYRKNWLVAAIVLGVVLLASIPAGALIQMPGANMLQSFAIIISLYIPASIVIGWFFAELAETAITKYRLSGTLVITGFMLLAALVGTWRTRAIASPGLFALVTRPDLRAMHWIDENLPADARLLVEGFSIDNGSSAVGADAGWWISLLGRRQNSMPPQYALVNERPEPPDYSERVIQLVNQLEEKSPGTLEVVQALCAEQVTHAYIGQHQGLIGGGARQLFNPSDFDSNQFWESVYAQDRVKIYAIRAGICKQ